MLSPQKHTHTNRQLDELLAAVNDLNELVETVADESKHTIERVTTRIHNLEEAVISANAYAVHLDNKETSGWSDDLGSSGPAVREHAACFAVTVGAGGRARTPNVHKHTRTHAHTHARTHHARTIMHPHPHPHRFAHAGARSLDRLAVCAACAGPVTDALHPDHTPHRTATHHHRAVYAAWPASHWPVCAQGHARLHLSAAGARRLLLCCACLPVGLTKHRCCARASQGERGGLLGSLMPHAAELSAKEKREAENLHYLEM